MRVDEEVGTALSADTEAPSSATGSCSSGQATRSSIAGHFGFVRRKDEADRVIAHLRHIRTLPAR
jgi:hypothetical protein